jgi:hypothetical protein
MKAHEFLPEASKDWNEIRIALNKINAIRTRPEIKKWSDHTPEDLAQVTELAKITGRRLPLVYGFSVGEFLDLLKTANLEKQIKSGKLPAFTGRASTVREIAETIALHTNGQYRRNPGRVWTDGYGQRSKDASDFIRYADKESYDDALEWVKSKGKPIHYKTGSSLYTAIKIGKFMIEPSSITRSPYGDSPQTEYRLSVRSAASANQGTRAIADITDQQAASLRDIAQTKNANAMDMINAIHSMFKGEAEVKQIIDSSKKITPADKAKLDQIIASARNFKELD